MKLITCTGYYGTGSSAITDLLSEYSNIQTNTDFEINFIYNYHGVNDLYYYLIDQPVRECSNRAIRDFYKMCIKLAHEGKTMNYEVYFNHHFLEYTREYIQKIGGTYHLYYYLSDVQEKSCFQKMFYKVFNKIYGMIYIHLINRGKLDFSYNNTHLFLKKEPFYFHTFDKDVFIEETKSYFEKLFASICKKEFFMVDHFVSTSTIDECIRYFDNIKVFVVDRDPRDVYLLEKYRWHGTSLPTDNIYAFCEKFRWVRNIPSHINSSSNIMKLQFENMVFKYEETINEIEKFIGIKKKDHISPQKYFNPKVSINNCRLWEEYPNEKDNIDIIKKELNEWIYEN